MAILMIFEMTQEYSLILPFMLVCITVNFVVLPFNVFMYSAALKCAKGEGEEGVSLFGALIPSNLTVAADDSLATVQNRMMVSPYNHLHVVDQSGRWLGVVGRSTARTASESSAAREMVHAESRYIDSAMTLEQAVQAAAHIPSEMMPVVEAGSMRFLGTLSKSDLLLHLQKAWRGKPDQQGAKD